MSHTKGNKCCFTMGSYKNAPRKGIIANGNMEDHVDNMLDLVNWLEVLGENLADHFGNGITTMQFAGQIQHIANCSGKSG